MDIVAHTLWATAAAQAANQKVAKIGVAWFAVWTMFPDLLAFAPEVIVRLWYRCTGLTAGSVDLHHIRLRQGGFEVDLYDVGHSLVVFSAVYLIACVILRRPPWGILGWMLHILLDIPSHSVHYATPFLWPLSSFRIVGVSWHQWWFVALNYGILAVMWLLLWIHRLPHWRTRRSRRLAIGVSAD
jgi:hypothetical protein